MTERKEKKTIKVSLKDRNKICNPIWHSLPLNEYDLVKEMGVENINDIEIVEVEITAELIEISVYTFEELSFEELNKVAKELQKMDDKEKRLVAIFTNEFSETIETAIQMIKEHEYTIIKAFDAAELAKYAVKKGDILQEEFYEYFNFEEYGEDLESKLNGCFTSLGYVIQGVPIVGILA